MKRHVLALTAGAVVLTGAAVPAAAAPSPHTLGPAVVAWWSAANQSPALPPVGPPDAGPHDLYVAGANALPAGVGLPASTGPVAIAGLQYRLPAGASPDTLRLQLAGTHPPAVTLTACRATEPFEAAYAGAWSDAPTYDCTDAGTARLAADGSVVIDGVDELVDGQELAVVLVPGPLDRVVIAAPDDKTLTVTGSSAGELPPGEPLPPAPPVAPPAAASGGVPLAGSGLPAALQSPMPTSGGAAPVVASPAPAPPAAKSAAAVLRARPIAALLATLLLALLAFVPMVRPRTQPATALGPRGVGRFRSERTGAAPGLS